MPQEEGRTTIRVRDKDRIFDEPLFFQFEVACGILLFRNGVTELSGDQLIILHLQEFGCR